MTDCRPYVRYRVNPLYNRTLLRIRKAARKRSYFPVGTFRRSSSKKFMRKITRAGLFPPALLAVPYARRIAPGMIAVMRTSCEFTL
jgi:hypothetical protein